MTTKIALCLSAMADGKTRRQFFSAVEQINGMLNAWMERKPGGVGAMEKWDVQGSVVWISVNDAEPINIETCNSIARLVLERHAVGDKYEILLNPNTAPK